MNLTMSNKYIGKWRITEMEFWDSDFIDLVAKGQIILKKDQLGEFQFGAVEAEIDYRIERINNLERLEFSWEGCDDSDQVHGRGWAVIKGDELHGKLYFHLGDDSWFKATRNK
jgi:hypothetical protein